MYHAIDLAALDEYLSSDNSPENCMMLSDLDGFIHAMLCSPTIIPSDECMQRAIGADPDPLPHSIVQSVADLFGTVSHGLTSNPLRVEPVFWEANAGHVLAMDWC